MRAVGLVVLLGCSRPGLPFDEITVQTPPGVSDITVDDRGTPWVIPERVRELDEVTLEGRVTSHPLDGVPDGLDTEGLAWLGDRFAIGTEGEHEATASVLFAERRDDRFVVTASRELTSRELGVPLDINRGAEGVCGRGPNVLVAIETVGILPDGSRYAPIAWLAGDDIAVTKLHLTSERGKISALTCAIDGTTAHVVAIERHYAVSKVLAFDVVRGAPDVTPHVVYDLGSRLNNRLNLEGIARLPDGRLIAVNDNQGSQVRGPTELLVFR